MTFTEEDFAKAVDNASYWAKRRMLKKLDKRIYRNGEVRMAKDVDQYVANFVALNKDKK